jgi:hypothetical protein
MHVIPNVLVSIDPGLRHCGVAVFEYGKLIHATLVDNPIDGESDAPVWAGMTKAVHDHLANNYYRPNVLVLEKPQVYVGGRGKGNPNDLISLACIVGGLASVIYAPEKKAYLPRIWKGQVPKEIHNTRVLAKLTDAERVVMPDLPASKLHNVIDAVGLGLYEVER